VRSRINIFEVEESAIHSGICARKMFFPRLRQTCWNSISSFLLLSRASKVGHHFRIVRIAVEEKIEEKGTSHFTISNDQMTWESLRCRLIGARFKGQSSDEDIGNRPVTSERHVCIWYMYTLRIIRIIYLLQLTWQEGTRFTIFILTTRIHSYNYFTN